MSRLRGIIALTLALVVAGSITASARSRAPSIQAAPTFGPPTTKVTVTGTGFGPTEVIDVTFASRPLAKATADPTGAFSKRIKVPAWALPGNQTVTATGESSHLTASAPFTVRTDWPMFHLSEDRRGYNRYENVLSPANVANLTVKWKAHLAAEIGASPAVLGGAVYVGDLASTLYRFDAATGAKVWSTVLNGNPSSPAVWNDMVIVGSELGGRVYALDSETGQVRWFHQTGAGVFESPLVSGGLVYVGSNDGYLYALDASTGDVMWTAFIDGDTGSPAIANGIVYVGSYDTHVYAFDALTGATVWRTHIRGFPGTPAISNGLVYVGDSNSGPYGVRALDAKTGVIEWTYTVNYYVLVAPAVANGTVYFGTTEPLTKPAMYAVDAKTGDLVWSSAVDDDIASSAAVANGVVYVGSDDRNVYAFDALDGTVLWSYQTNGFVGSSPAVADGTVYVGSFDGYLYAFGLPG